MNDEQPQTRDFLDKSLRTMLTRPENLRAVLKEVVPDLVGGFDFGRMREARRENFLGNWRSRVADLLFEIPYRLADGERWALVCVLLEHQTKTEWRVPLTTLIYATFYWEWQLRLWEEHPTPKPTFQLTPILPVVLHTGSRPWGSTRNLQDLVVEPAAFRAFVPNWQPMFWELAEHSPEHLLNGSDALFQALSVLRVEKKEFAEVERTFREALERIDSLQNTDMVRWQELIQFMFGWAHNRRPELERTGWRTILDEWQTHQTKPEANKMIVTIADAMRREAKLEHAQAILLRLGRSRFGEPDATEFQTIRAIDDVDRLDRMCEALLGVKNWEELLSVV